EPCSRTVTTPDGGIAKGSAKSGPLLTPALSASVLFPLSLGFLGVALGGRERSHLGHALAGPRSAKAEAGHPHAGKAESWLPSHAGIPDHSGPTGRHLLAELTRHGDVLHARHLAEQAHVRPEPLHHLLHEEELLHELLHLLLWLAGALRDARRSARLAD